MSMIRNLRDSALEIVRALPAQNNNVDSGAIELGLGVPESIQVEISVPATPALADGQTLTFTLQDSADGVTFAAIPELETFVRTGAGGAGAPAAKRRVKLPPSVRQHLRMNIAASATAGNNTAVSATLALVG